MYMLAHRKTRPTGRRLARALGLPFRYKTPRPNDTLGIRWGTAEHPSVPSALQQAQAIARASNKLVSLQCFARDGVPCPTFSRALALPTTETWFGRRSRGMCGTDIQVFPPGVIPRSQTHEFYSKYIPCTREYRIHVFKETILGVMGKYRDFPDQGGACDTAGVPFIKNYGHGYRFRTPDKQLNSDRTDAAIAAVKSLGLDFGAVDIIIGRDDNQVYVLEVNTAPALAPLTFDKYMSAIKEELGLA